MDRSLDSLRARTRWWWHETSAAALSKVVIGLKPWGWKWTRYLPESPFGRPERTQTWRPVDDWQTPEQLRGVRGAMLDEAEHERMLHERRPFHDFFGLHPEGIRLSWHYGGQWILPTLRLLRRQADAVAASRRPAARPTAGRVTDARALTAEIRAEALRLGFNAVGFAPYDPRYEFAETAMNAGPLSRGSVIVRLLEQDYKVTQTIPRSKAERSIMYTYMEMAELGRDLCDFLHERGIEAQVQGPGGRLASIPFAVQAGLGQLGLNGQLLTPAAGSRVRLCLVTTDAELVHDEPVDFGIHAICDECQICVKRCPSGAIPNKRKPYRGVVKAKIKPERCLPVQVQVHGCGICMKVCPVQRFGLEDVTKHLVETGEILGKGTDDLEGYHWLDGRHYGPGHKPRITKEFMTPLGIAIDPKREEPPPQEPEITVELVS
jgi:epoxyqueuosine reductase